MIKLIVEDNQSKLVQVIKNAIEFLKANNVEVPDMFPIDSWDEMIETVDNEIFDPYTDTDWVYTALHMVPDDVDSSLIIKSLEREYRREFQEDPKLEIITED